MENFFEELRTAIKNVEWLLHSNGLVDNHGLVYWAEEVERLTKELNEGMSKAMDMD